MLDNLLTDQKMESFLDSLMKKTEENKRFFEGSLCQRMIDDVINSGKSLSCDDISYAIEVVQERFGWQDLDKDTINKFLDVLVDNTASPADFYLPIEDETWSEWACIKKGLYVHSISGQGTLYLIRAATDEELVEASKNDQ